MVSKAVAQGQGHGPASTVAALAVAAPAGQGQLRASIVICLVYPHVMPRFAPGVLLRFAPGVMSSVVFSVASRWCLAVRGVVAEGVFERGVPEPIR